MLRGCTPWPPQFAQDYRQKGYWEGITLGEMLDMSVEEYGPREALVFNDQRVTYRELGDRVNRLAFHFAEQGLKPLDRVLLQLPNIPEFVYVYFALVKIGVIPVMALPPHRQTEIRHFIKYSEAVGYFIPSVYRKFDYRGMAGEMVLEFPNLKHVFVAGDAHDGQISISKLLDAPVKAAQVAGVLKKYRPNPDEVALMLLSGGTTALPKLIPRTHDDYVLNSKASGLVSEFNQDTTFLAVLPLAHNYTLSSPGIQGTLFCGGKVVIAPGVDPETVFSLVEKEKVNVIAAAVPLVSNWLNSPIPALYNLTSLKVVQNGGAKLAPELRKRLQDKFGCTPQEVFGTAEGLLNMTRLSDQGDILYNSSGAPVMDADEIKVVDENGKEVPDGEPGELLCRGPYTIRGYYNAPEINRQAFTKDGFYHMGDVVRKYGRYIYAEGRKKDLINRGGEKISCDEVENFIFAYPKVKEVCLVAMPDEVFGEKACAFVVPKAGEVITFEELIQFLLKQNIAKFKLPERLELVEQFPISPAGKILKRALREMITEKLLQEKGKIS